MSAKERFGNAQTSTHSQDIALCRQPAFVYIQWCSLQSKILNVELNDFQRKQASLPVQMDRLGVRSAYMLAPLAFLASAPAMVSLQNAILPESLHDTEDLIVSFAVASWKTLTHNDEPIRCDPTHPASVRHIDGM